MANGKYHIQFRLNFIIHRAKRRILRFDKQNQQQSSDADGASAGKPKSGPYKRVGGTGSNIHRLSDTRDSDDENNTWNGNSTQQQ